MEESLNHADFKDCIEREFGEARTRLNEYSPLTLAFVGDAVFSLVIRTVVVERGNVPVNRLHKATTALVQANKQAEIMEALLDSNSLTEQEQDIYRRGRNAKSGSSAKNASIQTYRKATGLEALVGYLYLAGNMERIVTLTKMGLEQTETVV